MHESELRPQQLYQECRLDELAFNTTDDFDDMGMTARFIGQPRAEEALHFGVGIQRDGYNIFALGEQGTGKHTFIRDFLERRAEQEAVPGDICYVNNFEQRHSPRLLTLKAGQGKALAEDMKQLIEDIRNAMQAALENEEYRNRAQSIADELREKQKHAFEELRRIAGEKELVTLSTPGGLAFAPAKDGGEGLSNEEYDKLSDEEKQNIEQNAEEMQKEAQRLMQNIPQWQREIREKQKAFNREVTEYTIDPLIDELKEKYADHEAVRDYLRTVRDDLVENVRDLFPGGGREQGPQEQLQQALQGRGGTPTGGGVENQAERRYRVNVLVDHSKSRGAPVVYEENPTYQNLFGRVEHLAQMGALITDFTMIRAGALHRANGGYLILDALKVIREPFAWEGLKRALRSGKLKIESIGQMYSLISTVSLEPEALPVKIKVVMTGIPLIYYLLRHHDADFGDLFKVPADFARRMDRTPHNQHEFVRLIAAAVRQQHQLPFKRKAVARVIERGSRVVGDARKLSLHMEGLANLLREADYWARRNGRSGVEAEHVEKAVDSWIYRSDRMRENMQEQIQRDILMIETDGARVGQVNGLSVISLGDFAFGRPSRITARIR